MDQDKKATIEPIEDEDAAMVSGGEGEGRGEIGVETICIRCRARVPGRNDTCASCGSGDVTWI